MRTGGVASSDDGSQTMNNKPAPNDTTSTEPLVESEQERQTPLVRVSLLGEFHLVWQVSPATNEALWNSRTSARVLLKLLLCAPSRQAPKGVLAGILWPESEEEKARESLRQASAVLRKMVRSADGVELLEQRHEGEILKLADQARLWVDADAFEALLAQASRATTSEEAFRCWQEAYALLRGEMLADDQASEWVRHGWVKRRKQSVWLARCRLIRHLADAYVQRGHMLLAEEVLEQHLVRFPTDQDALYRLLVLLEQQGCSEQASVLYEQAKRSLQAAGKQPNHQVKACYERMQAAVSSQPPIVFAPSTRVTQEHSASFLERPGPLQEHSVTTFIGTTMQGLALLSRNGRSVDSPVTLNALRTLLEGEERQGGPLISRRQFIELGIAACITHLAQLDSTCVSAVEREELGRALSQSIADGWKMLLTTANAEVLAVSQFQLALIHQAHPLLYPSTRSYLYAGAYGLLGLALQHQNRNEEALRAYHHAHLAAVATRDPWYIAQSLICQADTYQTLGMYTEAFHVIEEALLGLGEIDEAHRRARAHLLGCWADVAMTTGDYALAQHKLDESARSLEHLSANEEFDRGSWFNLAGKYAFATGNYPTAIGYFQQALAEAAPDWMIHRVFALLPMMASYACEGDHDACVTAAGTAFTALAVLNAPALNRIFTTTSQEILKAFPNADRLRSLVVDARQQLSS